MTIIPSDDDRAIESLVVAVHGIGSQYRYSTVQALEKQFAQFCGWNVTQPLGAFHPAKLITEPDSPELGAYLFTPPALNANHFNHFGFAEVFWADIPEMAVDTKNTTEESKEWAQTVVDRVRAVDEFNGSKSNLVDYNKAGAVVGEMIDTIRVLESLLFIAKKAGLFEFDLGQLLTDYLGDVQIVADFKDYGGNVFDRFADTMAHLDHRMPNLKNIYIVAHSEGTVVSFKGILTALSLARGTGRDWVDKVKGYMTFGSPLNKHIVLWPGLWNGMLPHPSRTNNAVIQWRNYYDFGDPVGFDLQITRDWMGDHRWSPHFEFSKENDDIGFTRYPFPGKAHIDYWNDPVVFGHFIKDVVLKQGPQKKPATIPVAKAVSLTFPYCVCLALLAGGTYVLYKAMTVVLNSEESTISMASSVLGIMCLIAGTTILSRMPRLDKAPRSILIGLAGFAIGGAVCWKLPSSDQLHAELQPPVLICAGLVIGLISAGIGKWKPNWGMRPMIGFGGVVACWILWNLIRSSHHPNVAHVSLWPVALANAAFLYLWWLSALIFDLTYIWHNYIRQDRVSAILKSLRDEKVAIIKANLKKTQSAHLAKGVQMGVISLAAPSPSVNEPQDFTE